MRNFFEKLNIKLDNVKNHSFVKGINITSQVFWNLLLIVAVLMVMLALFLGGAGAGYFVSLVEDQEAYSKEEFEQQVYNYEEVSDIYFDDDQYLGKIPSDLERKERSLDEMSEHLIHAVISTEDEYFFEHQGVVPKALLRATYQEVSGASTQSGGSTLTQQIIKNQLLTNEVSFDRKAKEIALALRVENYFEKEEILEAYLNIVPFGRNADGRNIAGAQSAAEGIFGVEASELNVAQSAFIAGLPKNPFVYTPFENGGVVKENFEAGMNRMHLVLDNMLENGFISEDEYEEALEYDIEENLTDPSGSLIEDYPYLTYEAQDRAARIIREDLLEKDGIEVDELDDDERQETLTQYLTQAKAELAHGGYNVHLTIKKDIYDAMQRSIADSQWFGPDRQGEDGVEPEEVGAILIDNQTGAILSFVGGRDFERENLNHATQAYRQNGSTMKPLLAYGPAIDQGVVQPGTVLPDVPSTYSNGREYTNYGDSYQGFVSVREALKESRNVPAVKTFQRVDHEASRQALIDMGFQRLEPDEPYESGSIGGLTYGATVEQNTNAFTTFGNEGKYHDSYLIEKIETKNGETVYQHEPDNNKVFSPQTAFLTIDMLRDVLKPGGTARALPGMMNFGGDWAGKTGTSNETKDSWFVGLNPNVTFGTWIGYDNPQTISSPYKGLSYGARTQRIWADMMNAAFDANPETFGIDDNFEQPEGIVRQTICGISGKLPSSLCSEAGLTTTDYFNEKFVPTERDNSLNRTRYVTINGKRYKAYDSTPSEFTQTGVSINEDYFDADNMSEYLPDDWDNIVADQDAPSNGRNPSQVTGISFSNGQLSWNQHPDNDIVGYRIYSSGGSKIKSVEDNTSTSTSVNGSGSFFVTAVDSMGRESTESASASGGGEADDDSNEDENENEGNENNQREDNEDTSDNENDENSESENENNEDENNGTENENGNNGDEIENNNDNDESNGNEESEEDSEDNNNNDDEAEDDD
ncbi:transglycosylase domain-containing protein [Alteribacillus sp. YIM 98480]|uniref:transglycosylase domain-containing protein n=1 Tax=Alteribacillus sp. YIM 98480 TaxID=2606599 RepID=UPI00131C4158|nr:transglycosylase domain-containing protein [Alteribacillus sp. YIM 98480]